MGAMQGENGEAIYPFHPFWGCLPALGWLPAPAEAGCSLNLHNYHPEAPQKLFFCVRFF